MNQSTAMVNMTTANNFLQTADYFNEKEYYYYHNNSSQDIEDDEEDMVVDLNSGSLEPVTLKMYLISNITDKMGKL